MGFTDKVVLVTGASGGIGRAVAKAFADREARIAVAYHKNRDGAVATVHELPGRRRGPGGGPGHELFSADLTSTKAAAKLVNQVVDRMGGLDILVNNAGVWLPHPILETEEAEWNETWEKTLRTNLVGPAALSYHCGRRMAEHGGGSIIAISSRAAFRGEPLAPAYAASKAALNAMSQSLAVALAPHGVFVGVIAPGFVETERILKNHTGPRLREIRRQNPMGRMARPEEIAEAVVFLASGASPAMTGAIIDVNGASYLRS